MTGWWWALLAGFVFVVIYPYGIYPALIACWACWARLVRRPHLRGPYTGTVSLILVVRNEARALPHRLRELSIQLASCGPGGELIVVSDGSTDDTAVVAQACETATVIVLPSSVGKAAALSVGVQRARGEIVVFADARQTWSINAMRNLLENFADASVGAASGELVIPESASSLRGVGLYWRFEKWLRRSESVIHSSVGVTGAISAVRRPLFREISTGTILDDVVWPLHVAMQGFRIVHDVEAVCIDRLPTAAVHEFRRKVRTLCGNYQLFGTLPAAFSSQNPIRFQLVSHKVLRLAVPWALLGILALSMFGFEYPIARLLLISQLVFYGTVGVSIWRGASRPRLVCAATAFVMMNAAAWVAFWVWAFGRADRVWVPTPYEWREPAARVEPMQ